MGTRPVGDAAAVLFVSIALLAAGVWLWRLASRGGGGGATQPTRKTPRKKAVYTGVPAVMEEREPDLADIDPFGTEEVEL